MHRDLGFWLLGFFFFLRLKNNTYHGTRFGVFLYVCVCVCLRKRTFSRISMREPSDGRPLWPWLLIAVLDSLGFPAVTSGTERTHQGTRPKRHKRCGSIPGPARPLEEGMATHCYILPRESHGQGRLEGCYPSQRVRQDSSDLAHMHTGFFGDLPQWFSKTCAKLSQIALTVRLQGQGQVSPHSWESSTPIKGGSFHFRFRGLPVYSSESWAWWCPVLPRIGSNQQPWKCCLKHLLGYIGTSLSLPHHLYYCFSTTFKLSIFS